MMQANWSLIINVLLLIGVVAAIVRILNTRRKGLNSEYFAPNSGTVEKNLNQLHNDDGIISIRKVTSSPICEHETGRAEKPNLFSKSKEKMSEPRLIPDEDQNIELKMEPKVPREEVITSLKPKSVIPSIIMVFLVAKENRQFAGYELLQTVLAAGLRFGEGHLFHRHQFSNGQGPILCSLATATETGVFDLQNIGAFSVRGLCLFMHPSKNPGIDIERFSVLLETARQLSEGLDAYLLDDQRKPLTEERIARYHRLLQIDESFVLDEHN